MRHLSRERMLALIEAEAPPREPHLSDCPRCRTELEQLRGVMADLRGAPVPEPSPLFWDHFSARVSDLVRAEPRPPRAWWQHPGLWRIVVPVGALASIVAAAVLVGWRAPFSAPVDSAAPMASVVADVSWETSDVESTDGHWDVLAGLCADFDVETVSQTAITPQGATDEAMWRLSEDEKAELLRLIKVEMQAATGS